MELLDYISVNSEKVKSFLEQGNQALNQKDILNAESYYIEALFHANQNRLEPVDGRQHPDLILCFNQLAEIAINKVEQVNDKGWENISYCRGVGDNLLQAVVFLNAALIINNKLNNSQRDVDNILTKKIKLIEQLFLSKVLHKTSSIEENWGLEVKHQETLKVIKVKVEEGLKSVEQIETKSNDDHSTFIQRAKVIKGIYAETNKAIKEDLLGLMIQESINTLSKIEYAAPCQYAFVCFGSLAKQSATPYSDIEFGILLDKGQDAPGNKRYFYILSYLLGMKVANLGQTAVPFDLFKTSNNEVIGFDDIIVPGFQFDLGGKTPLNRKYLTDVFMDDCLIHPAGTDKYELINTALGLSQYLEDKYFEVDKLLPVELMDYSYLFGNEEIVDQYRKCVSNYFEDSYPYSYNKYQTKYQARALQVLLQGNEQLTSDIEKFQPRLNEEGELYKIKLDMYRLPDRLISGLCHFFKISAESTFEKLNLLEKIGVINKTAKDNLFVFAYISKEFRLRIYHAYEGQREDLETFSVFFGNDDLNKQDPFNKKLYDLISKAKIIILLFKFYYIAIPFFNDMRRFCLWKLDELILSEDQKTKLAIGDGDVNKKWFANQVYYNDSPHLKGKISLRFQLYDRAEASFISAIEVTPLAAIDLMDLYKEKGKSEEILTLIEQLRKKQIVLNSQDFDRFPAINDEQKEQLYLAICACRQEFFIRQNQSNHQEIASIKNELERLHKKLDHIENQVVKDFDYISISKLIYKLLISPELEEKISAVTELEKLEKVSDIKKSVLKDSYFDNLVSAYLLLGAFADGKNKYKVAKEYLIKAIQVGEVNQALPKRTLICAYVNYIEHLLACNKYDLEKCEIELNTYRHKLNKLSIKIFGSQPHLLNTKCDETIGDLHFFSRRHEKALEYYKKTETSINKIYSLKKFSHSGLGFLYMRIGLSYYGVMPINYEQAIIYLSRAKEIFIKNSITQLINQAQRLYIVIFFEYLGRVLQENYSTVSVKQLLNGNLILNLENVIKLLLAKNQNIFDREENKKYLKKCYRIAVSLGENKLIEAILSQYIDFTDRMEEAECTDKRQNQQQCLAKAISEQATTISDETALTHSSHSFFSTIDRHSSPSSSHAINSSTEQSNVAHAGLSVEQTQEKEEKPIPSPR